VTEQLLLILAAAVVGVLVGLTGVGGGAIMTPVLIIFFSVQPVVAIATDLVFATITKLISTFVHAGHGSVDWRTARELWRGSIPGVLIGVFLVLLVGFQFEEILSGLLVLILLFTGYSLIRSGGLSSKRLKGSIGTAVASGFIGFSVAVTSVGAGALGMALLRAKLGDGNPRQLVGTDVVHAIPIALIAGSTYAFAGFVDIQLLVLLLLGSIPGAVTGSLFARRVDAGSLRTLLGAVLLVAAAGIAMKSF
jgi:uncharacterized protein